MAASALCLLLSWVANEQITQFLTVALPCSQHKQIYSTTHVGGARARIWLVDWLSEQDSLLESDSHKLESVKRNRICKEKNVYTMADWLSEPHSVW